MYFQSFFPRIFQTKWDDGKILPSLTYFAKAPWSMARFSKIELNISEAKAKNVKFGKKQRYFNFLPDFRYFTIC